MRPTQQSVPHWRHAALGVQRQAQPRAEVSGAQVEQFVPVVRTHPPCLAVRSFYVLSSVALPFACA